MAAAVTQHMHDRVRAYNSGCPSAIVCSASVRLVRSQAWAPRKGFSVRLHSEPAPGHMCAWQCGLAQTKNRDANHPAPHAHGRAAISTPATAVAVGTDTNIESWKWQEPVLDASLSTADRAVLALVRAAANLSDKVAAERTAAAHGLSLVTNSDVCVGPLLPPFGSTLEDDGEEGDGMAPLPPAPSPTSPSLGWRAGEPVRREGSSTLAGGASALLNAILAGGGASGAAVTAGGSNGTVSAHKQRQTHFRAGSGTYDCGDAASADERLRRLARMVAEGGGGDEVDGYESDDEEVRPAASAAGRGGERAASWSATVGAQGLMGAAAAALTRVARAASSTAADMPVPVGRAAAGAASAAAAAVAKAAKATAHMLPNYGDPSSSWLVADDPAGGVRYIVIAAGPELRRRTPQELTTDLVTFETYDLGAKVNRRLYGEAMALYARFMPLVMDFLEAVPDGNICFGGQGVGGSLAVLLQLMCCNRGLRFARLLPAVAVDAPAAVGQVPREQRRLWGPAGREQQRQLPQDSLDDVLEDLMQRSVLEELGLPQDAVRNLVLPPPPSPSSRAQPPHASLPGGLLVLAAADAAGGAPAAAAGGGGAVAASAGSASHAQIFRLVGKVIHVETIGHLSFVVSASAPSSQATLMAIVPPSPTGVGDVLEAVVEADGGSGALATAAAAAPGSSYGGLGAAAKQLDVATVSNIATAAATAAASVAVERLRHVGAGALRAVTAVEKGRGGGGAAAAAAVPAAAAAVSTAGGFGALAATSSGGKGPVRQKARWSPAAGEADEADEDTSAWGV